MLLSIEAIACSCGTCLACGRARHPSLLLLFSLYPGIGRFPRPQLRILHLAALVPQAATAGPHVLGTGAAEVEGEVGLALSTWGQRPESAWPA